MFLAASAQGLPVKRSHLFEVIAALLGYCSYAALTIEEADATKVLHLDDAEIIVLNQALGLERAVGLGLQGPPDRCSLCDCIEVNRRSCDQRRMPVHSGLVESDL